MLFELAYDIWIKTPGWIAAVIVCFVISGFFLIQARNKELEVTKKVITGYAFFILGFAMCRILFIFSDFEREVNDVSQLYIEFVILGYIFNIAAFSWLAHIIEKYLMQSKSRFTTKIMIATLIVTGVMFVLGALIFNSVVIMIARISVYIGSTMAGFIVFLFYAQLIKQTTGDVKRRCLISFVGICVLFTGVVMDSEYIMRNLPIWLPSLIVIAGLLIFMQSYRIEKK